jgi:small subunit ribosomal protein S4e
LATGGNNIGRIGILQHVEKHPGSFDIAHVKDSNGNSFATRIGNIFVIGEGKKPIISLLPNKGLKLGLLEERRQRLEKEHN